MTGGRPDRVPETCTSDTVCVRVRACVSMFMCGGRREDRHPHGKLMLLPVGGHLFLVAAWWAGAHGDIFAFVSAHFISFSAG